MASDTTQLATSFETPPNPPSSSVPITDPAWRDYFTKQQQWQARFATYATQIAAAVVALQPSTTSSGS